MDSGLRATGGWINFNSRKNLARTLVVDLIHLFINFSERRISQHFYFNKCRNTNQNRHRIIPFSHFFYNRAHIIHHQILYFISILFPNLHIRNLLDPIIPTSDQLLFKCRTKIQRCANTFFIPYNLTSKITVSFREGHHPNFSWTIKTNVKYFHGS